MVVHALACLLVLPVGSAFSQSADVLTLREAVERALAKAPVLGLARAAAQESEAAARLAGTAFQPAAWLVSTPGYARGLPLAVAGQVPAFVGASIRETLYDPNRQSEIFMARARAIGAQGLVQRVQIDATVSAALLYGRCFWDQRSVENTRLRLAATEALLAHTEALLKEGRRSELDVERVSLQLARARQQLLDVQSTKELDELELGQLIGWVQGRPLVLGGDPLFTVPEPAAHDSTPASDPELASLDRQIAALRRSLSWQQKAWTPVVDAEVRYARVSRATGYDRFYTTFEPNAWAVGVSVAVPVWTGGRSAQLEAETRAKLDQLESEHHTKEKSLELGARRAEAALDRAVATLNLAQRGFAVAQKALQLAQLRAGEGRGEPGELENQQIAVADAEEEVVKTSLGLLGARVGLLAIRGEFPSAVREGIGAAQKNRSK